MVFSKYEVKGMMFLSAYGRILLTCIFVVCFSSCTGGNPDKKTDDPNIMSPHSPEEPDDTSSDPTSQDSISSPTSSSSENPSAGSSEEDSPSAKEASGSEGSPPSGPSTEEVALTKGKPEADPTPLVGSLEMEEIPNLPPPEETWNLTWEKIASFDFLKKGGSGLFRYYIQFWLNEIGSIMQHFGSPPRYKSRWSSFCYNPDCLDKGLNLAKIEAHHMPFIIDQLARMPMFVVSSKESKESIFFLQAGLAPKDWHFGKNTESDPHIINLQDLLEGMKPLNVTRIAVNLALQPHVDLRPFFLLGEFIKENQIDLHIVGNCEFYCAHYLIPAAKTVYIEPYGSIFLKGSFYGLHKDVFKVVPAQIGVYAEDFKERMPSPEERINFTHSQIKRFLTLGKGWDVFLNDFKRSFPEEGGKFAEEFTDFYLRERGTVDLSDENPFADFTESEAKVFLQGLSPEQLEDVYLFIALDSYVKPIESSRFFESLKVLKKEEADYYEKIRINELNSNENYNYLTLLELSAMLVRDQNYEKHFSVPRYYYGIPEEDKPYSFVFPSADLLRSVGIDIRGENNMEMVGIDKNSKKDFLYLDNERIENCELFKAFKSRNTEDLECLFR